MLIEMVFYAGCHRAVPGGAVLQLKVAGFSSSGDDIRYAFEHNPIMLSPFEDPFVAPMMALVNTGGSWVLELSDPEFSREEVLIPVGRVKTVADFRRVEDFEVPL